MTTDEQHETGQVEQRSKIKLTRNAKGDPQWEISVVTGETDETLDLMRTQAVSQWNALMRDLGIAA